MISLRSFNQGGIRLILSMKTTVPSPQSPIHVSKESTASAAAALGAPVLQFLARFIETSCEALRAELRAISASIERCLALPQNPSRSVELTRE